MTLFIANAGHELRTPLAVVQATVETLQLGGRFSGVEAEFLSRVDTSAKRMGALVEELMDLTMMETGKIPLHLAPFAVADLFAATCDELRPIADRRGVEIDDGDVPGDLMVRGDADKLQRALANLVGNGIKFSEPDDTVKLSAAAEGEWVVLRVQDEGRGIDAEHLPRVFDRFFRTESGGSDDAGFGLGLAIALNVVELQGGPSRWRARSASGRRSRSECPHCVANDIVAWPVLSGGLDVDKDSVCGYLR